MGIAAACSRGYLKDVIFADNTTQNISPADLRLLVDCVYGSFVDITRVIDNLDTYDSYLVLSANQGALLSDKVEDNVQNIENLENGKANKSEVYTQGESDSRYYTQDQTDDTFATKNGTYNKQEIDQALRTIQDQLDAIIIKLDCLNNEHGNIC